MTSAKQKAQDAQALSESFWNLLTLERDVTLHGERPNQFAKSDIDETLCRYQTLSQKLFGQVRADRQPKEPLVESDTLPERAPIPYFF